MNAQISVIVPAHNAEKYLSETIDSVLAQTFFEWELIVVNDGSSDGTGEIADRYARADARIRAVHQTNQKVAATRNNGFALCSPGTKYVIFLDADDTWEPDTLATLSAALDRSPDAVAAHGLARYIDRDSRLLWPGLCEGRCRIRATLVGNRVVSLPPSEPTTFATLIVGGCMTTGSTLIRRSTLETVGGFDTSLKQCEDWDIYIRLSRRGPLAFVDQVFLNYRMHDTNVTKNRSQEREMERHVLRKAFASEENSEEQRRMVRKCFRAGQLFFMASKLKFAGTGIRRGDLRSVWTQVRPLCGHALRYAEGRP
jgi:glycosyltransferase involved in cell wall biosynthesis